MLGLCGSPVQLVSSVIFISPLSSLSLQPILEAATALFSCLSPEPDAGGLQPDAIACRASLGGCKAPPNIQALTWGGGGS